MSSFIHEPEEIKGKQFVLCCVCNRPTREGIKQHRMYALESGRMAKMDLYMCMSCLNKGEPWPGVKPHNGMKDTKIQNEFDRFNKNRKVYLR